MSDDLKNCPFCGEDAKLDHNGDYSWAYCTKCDAMTQPEISEDDAMDKWNLRVEDWISVDDKMPEENQFVDVWDDGERGICNKYSDGKFWELIEYKHEFELHEVAATHWMPLPEPPK